MRCPSCKGEVDDRDWLCPYCEHILDPSVLGLDTSGSETDASPIRAERTRLVAWDPRPQEPEPEEPPEAMILGDVDVSGREFSVVQGPGAQPGGRTSTFLFYTAGSTSRIVHPDAVPALTQKDSTIPHTPYEHFILSCIDGRRSVRAIQRTSGLAPQEVVITILTLLDKGVIRVDVQSRPTSTAGATEDLPTSAAFTTGEISDRRPAVPTRQLLAEDDEDEDGTEDGYVPEPLPKVVPSGGNTRELDELAAERDAFSSSSPNMDPAREELLSKPLYPSTAGHGASALPEMGREPSRPIDADGLVEEEDDAAPVQPQELDESDSEMITDHSAPAIPMPRFDLKAEQPKPPPLKKEATPPPLLLDPEFLVEVPKSERAVAKDPRKTLEQATKMRAPIEERDRRKPGASQEIKKPSASQEIRKASLSQEMVAPVRPSPTPASIAPVSPASSLAPQPIGKVEPVKTEAAPEPPAPATKKSMKGAPVDGIRMAKAAKLFEEALKDKKEGNLVSARMNMKLALTFDPSNELYQQAFDDLAKGAGANAVPSKMKSRARELYDQATRAEEQGNVDEAIELLEKALQESKEAAYYNRLGVLLAMKKKEFARAQELIETALKLTPGNTTYQHNLGKVLSMAATHDVDAREKGGKKSGILGFLGRKK